MPRARRAAACRAACAAPRQPCSSCRARAAAEVRQSAGKALLAAAAPRQPCCRLQQFAGARAARAAARATPQRASAAAFHVRAQRARAARRRRAQRHAASRRRRRRTPPCAPSRRRRHENDPFPFQFASASAASRYQTIIARNVLPSLTITAAAFMRAYFAYARHARRPAANARPKLSARHSRGECPCECI